MTQGPPRRPQDAAHQPGRQHRPGPARGLAGRAAARGRRPPGHAAQRHRRQRHVVGDPGPRRGLDRGRPAAGGQVRRAGGAVRRGRPGLLELRPAGAVRRHQARRRPHRRPGAGGRVHGADRRGARHAVLPHGPDRGDRPAGRHAVHLRRQLALRRVAGGAATAAGQLGRRAGRAARDPGRRGDVRLPRPRPPPHRCRAPAGRRWSATWRPAARGTSSPSPTSAGRRWSRRSSTGWRPTSRPTPATPC